jgi:hypothetical protein
VNPVTASYIITKNEFLHAVTESPLLHIKHLTTLLLFCCSPNTEIMFRNLAINTSRTVRARQFSIASARRVEQYGGLSTNKKTKTDAYPDDKHAVNKAKDGETENIQEANAKDGMEWVLPFLLVFNLMLLFIQFSKDNSCMGLIPYQNANLFSAANKGSASGGHATEAKDSAGGAAKAKKEFPEAPDTIGMQDERGGRGGWTYAQSKKRKRDEVNMTANASRH